MNKPLRICCAVLLCFAVIISFIPHERVKHKIILYRDLDAFKVCSGNEVELDLNGHSIANESIEDAITVEPGAVLIIKGEGTVSNSGSGSLIFNEGECFLLDHSSFVHDAGGYAVINHGYMEISDGVVITSLRSGSSLIENGYYNYASGDAKTGFVSGWEKPELCILGGDFNGGRINK